KSDILDGLDEIQVCIGYRYKNERLKSFPTESWILEEIVPEYRTFKGWKEPVVSAETLEDLPREFLDYMSFIEDALEAEIAIVSTGVERRDTLLVDGVLSKWVGPEP
ncbi:MAG: adenylosuccinate synthetase, partial [Candidatus Aminicenantes bacterium]|nr:adenylosuccinate synthetase [Candidatus Aminicenantes bacterium]